MPSLLKRARLLHRQRKNFPVSEESPRIRAPISRPIDPPWEQSVQAFRLNTDTIGVAMDGKKPVAITIPRETIIQVVVNNEHRPMRQIIWNGTRASIFAQDLIDRGEEITAEQMLE
jgi:hypothetical protein